MAQKDENICVHIEAPTGTPREGRRRFLRAALVFLTATVSLRRLRAQVTSGTRKVRVFVTDSSGEIVISGAKAEVVEETGNSVRSCTTDETGECTLEVAQERNSQLLIQMPGFASYKTDVGSANEVRAKLQIGSTGGAILVRRHFWSRK